MTVPKWRETQHLYERDARLIRQEAIAILAQIDWFERHSKSGTDEQIRIALLTPEVARMTLAARRARRRWEKAHP